MALSPGSTPSRTRERSPFAVQRGEYGKSEISICRKEAVSLSSRSLPLEDRITMVARSGDQLGARSFPGCSCVRLTGSPPGSWVTQMSQLPLPFDA
jgi:hypothetical protein